MTVNVEIRLLGVFRGMVGRDQMSVKLKHATVRTAVHVLAESMPSEARRLLIDPELNDPRPNALVLLNGREINVLKGMETEVKNNDVLTIIPIAHGG
jgi:molybdopterin converting factor small subunit